MTISIANLPEEQRNTTVEFANYQMDDDAFYDLKQTRCSFAMPTVPSVGIPISANP